MDGEQRSRLTGDEQHIVHERCPKAVASNRSTQLSEADRNIQSEWRIGRALHSRREPESQFYRFTSGIGESCCAIIPSKLGAAGPPHGRGVFFFLLLGRESRPVGWRIALDLCG